MSPKSPLVNACRLVSSHCILVWGKADHPAREIISCQNGLVHWPTRKLYGHRPSFYVHHAVPFAFDPNAPHR
jgi:hypothetical protein